ncbi:zinc finger protein 502-like [Pleurodeles waltl]|uniref:zinc finger protein 502-like n=1 Tax=Pleurodeles waltl TaxID=8319 RepID=UPI0037093BAF
MPHQESGNARLTFQDVVACFSQEEWDLLHKWQKDLYSNLMKDIHQVLMILGPVVASSVFSLRAQETGGVGSTGDDRRRNQAHSPSASVSKLDEFTMSSEETQCQRDPLNINQRVRPDLFSAANIESPDLLSLDGDIPNLLVTGEFSVAMTTNHIKEEGEQYAVSYQNPEEIENIHNPAGFLPLSSDPEVNCVDPVDGDTGGGSPSVDAGMEALTCFMSSTTKEEVGKSSLGHQNSALIGSIRSLPGDPVAASVASLSFTDEKTLFQQETEDDTVNADDSSLLPTFHSASDSFKESPAPLLDPGVPPFLGEGETTHRSDIGNMNENEVHTLSQKKHQRVCRSTRSHTCMESSLPKVGSIKENESHTSAWKKQSKIFRSTRRFACTECGKRFNKKALLVAHQRTHDGLRPFPCTECEKSFTRLSYLRNHQTEHTGIRPFHCNVCEKSFMQSAHLLGHQGVHTGEKPYQCQECEKSFTRRQYLKHHQRIHAGDRPFHCTECEKSFFDKWYLLQHQRTHTKVKPYPCSECSKSFSLKSNLQRHHRIHTGVRPYSCTECEKSFTTKANLLRHQILHTGVRPFHCTECEKSFVQKSDLLHHQSKHTGLRPFQCNECEKSFIRMPELRNHTRTHTGERPYHCAKCEKSFFQRQDLVKHLRIHTREK